MENGRWFTLSIGRNRRADPKWILPMICKAGDVTKRDVGSIKILDKETRFEIAADKAEAFAAAIRENGTGEKGVTIQQLEGGPPSAAATSRRNRRGKRRPMGRCGAASAGSGWRWEKKGRQNRVGRNPRSSDGNYEKDTAPCLSKAGHYPKASHLNHFLFARKTFSAARIHKNLPTHW